MLTTQDAAAIVRPHNDLIIAQGEIARLTKALHAASGYLMNAKIDLETGAPKRTAVSTIEGGLKMIADALAASPISSADRQVG